MKKLFFLVIAAGLLCACKKFDSFNENPNKAAVTTPDALLNTLSQEAFNQVTLDAAMASRQMVNTDGVSNIQYYGWQRGSYSEFSNYELIYKMNQEAERAGQPAYIALGKFFKSWFSYILTLRFGDIPYSEAGLADEGNYTPVYDTQDAIFAGILANLDEANNMLNDDSELNANDIIYGGDVQQWKKLINSFSLRVLLTLSAKEGNVALGVKEKFARIVNNPTQYPIMESNADNAALNFFNAEGTQYPYYNNNSIKTAIYMEKSFVDLLKSFKDPRLFRYASPKPASGGLPSDDFDAYDGAYGSAPLDQNSAKVLAGQVSAINPRYYNDPVNEPSTALGYAEVQYLLAEASIRGWITNNAKAYYVKGIGAALAAAGVTGDQAGEYQDRMEAAGLTSGQEIKQINTQKYIAFFMNAGWQPFYEQRRTGFPVFNVDGGGVVNDKKIPKRWMYPESELQRNPGNIAAAISRQYPEGDNINGIMWVLKAE